jgi:hypothetical protein
MATTLPVMATLAVVAMIFLAISAALVRLRMLRLTHPASAAMLNAGEDGETALAELLAALGGAAPHDDNNGESDEPVPISPPGLYRGGRTAAHAARRHACGVRAGRPRERPAEDAPPTLPRSAASSLVASAHGGAGAFSRAGARGGGADANAGEAAPPRGGPPAAVIDSAAYSSAAPMPSAASPAVASSSTSACAPAARSARQAAPAAQRTAAARAACRARGTAVRARRRWAQARRGALPARAPSAPRPPPTAAPAAAPASPPPPPSLGRPAATRPQPRRAARQIAPQVGRGKSDSFQGSAAVLDCVLLVVCILKTMCAILSGK